MVAFDVFVVSTPFDRFMMTLPLIGITSHALKGDVVSSGMNQMYIDAVAAAGGVPVLIPLGLGVEALTRIYELLDGLFLPGGDDVAPERYGHQRHVKLGNVDDVRDELELTLARWALRDDLPILGICRGIQVLAVAVGGTLYQDLPSQLSTSVRHDVRGFGRDHLCHSIDLAPSSRLAQILDARSLKVNSFHHQAVWEVPDCFVVAATAPDGVIEAIEAPDRSWVVAVQCHPEGLWRSTVPRFACLFADFVSAAASFRSRDAEALHA